MCSTRFVVILIVGLRNNSPPPSLLVTRRSGWLVSISRFARKFLLSITRLYHSLRSQQDSDLVSKQVDSRYHSPAHSRALVPHFARYVKAFSLRKQADLWAGVLLKVIWSEGVGCTIVKSNTTVLAATFIYSMSFDLVVLCLTAYKLAWTPRRITGASGIHSKLVRMVFSDGLVYFILACVL